MSETVDTVWPIALSDLNTVAELVTMRLASQAAELERIAGMRAMLRATSGLNRALETYARHALVHCQGTAGTSDLSADMAELSRALQQFCGEMEQVATLSRRVRGEPRASRGTILSGASARQPGAADTRARENRRATR